MANVVNVVDIKGKKIKEVELPASLFNAPINIGLMHQAFVRQMANARLGTHQTKTRHEVSGGGKKPWRQKGTGRARQGSIRSAQWVGGGKIHTPHPRDYSIKMPKKMRRAAVRSALSARMSDGAIVIVDNFDLKDAKTKSLKSSVDKLTPGKSVLVVIPEKRDNVSLASKNLESVKVLLADYVNIRDLLQYEQVIIDLGAIGLLEGYLKTGKKA